jgi:tRNA (guanine-N7-)-methyltransferase
MLGSISNACCHQEEKKSRSINVVVVIAVAVQMITIVKGFATTALRHRDIVVSHRTPLIALPFISEPRKMLAVTSDGEKLSNTSLNLSQRKEMMSDEEGQQRQQQSIGELPVWNHPVIKAAVIKKRRENNLRFRQHVNPLSRLYQQPTILPTDWPSSVYTNVGQQPLHLDIGCGKGGFLIDLCQMEHSIESAVTSSAIVPPHHFKYNYLGLEIRPGVAAYANDRIAVHQLQGQLDFLGCNVNVDLDRILSLYQSQYCCTKDDPIDHAHTAVVLSSDELFCLHRVTIQFPDPHFKTQHFKRRVVTTKLVDTLAKYMPTAATVILQSDIKSVLDDMRRQFRGANATVSSDCTNTKMDDNSERCSDHYFTDSIVELDEYVLVNSLGVPTEREHSVLGQGLPVYRALLARSACPYQG